MVIGVLIQDRLGYFRNRDVKAVILRIHVIATLYYHGRVEQGISWLEHRSLRLTKTTTWFLAIP